MSQAITVLEQRIERLADDIERAESQYEDPECPHCGRQMDVGSMDGNKTRWGCYPPIGEERDEYSCPYFQEHGYAYSKERLMMDVEPLRRSKLELESVLRQIKLNGDFTGDGDQ